MSRNQVTGGICALTVDTRNREHDTRGAGTRVDVDLQAHGRVELVDGVVRERLPRLQALASLRRTIVRERVCKRDRVERGVRLRRERRDDPERRPRSSRRPEEVCVLRRGRSPNGPIGGDYLERRDLVSEETPCAGGQAEAALACVAAHTDVRAGPVRQGALACRVGKTGPQLEFHSKRVTAQTTASGMRALWGN